MTVIVPATVLKIARTARNLRLADAEALSGVPASNLARFEKCDAAISRREVEALARAYQVPVDTLLGRAPIELLGKPPLVGP